MKNFSHKNPTKGFTLIEIIVVLVILGVLAAIAVGAYFDCIERARAAEAVTEMKSIKDQIEACLSSKTDLNERQNCILRTINLANFQISTMAGEDTAPGNTTYMIYAVRRGYADTGGLAIGCEGGAGAAFINTHPSGVYMCRHPDGHFDTAGYGRYKGAF